MLNSDASFGNQQTSFKPEPCELLNGGPCALCVELEAFDDGARSIVDLLCEKRRTILEQVNHHHDPLIQCLPLELISKVFAFCLPQARVDIAPLEIELLYNRHRIRPFNIVLGAICGAWRHIAWSTPDLWSTLPIFLHCHSKTRLDLILEWLERSAHIPLDLAVGYDPRITSGHLTEKNIHLWKPLIDIINGCSSRWRTVNMDVPDFVHSYIVGDGDGICILERLTIQESQCSPNQRPSHRLSLMNALPAPSQLLLSTMPFRSIDIDYSNLTIVEIDDLYPNECLALLQKAQRLTTCTLYLLRPGQDKHLPSPSPTHHHALLRLDIDGLGDGITSEDLLPYLTLPSLVHLSCEFGDSSPESVIAFLQRSGCRLTTLHISNDYIQVSFLGLTPHLRELEVLKYEGNYLDSLIEILNNHMELNEWGGDTILLPNLRELSICAPRVSWRRPADLVPSRHLKTLSIYLNLDNVQEMPEHAWIDNESASHFQELVMNGHDIKIATYMKKKHNLLAWSIQRRVSETRESDEI